MKVYIMRIPTFQVGAYIVRFPPSPSSTLYPCPPPRRFLHPPPVALVSAPGLDSCLCESLHGYRHNLRRVSGTFFGSSSCACHSCRGLPSRSQSVPFSRTRRAPSLFLFLSIYSSFSRSLFLRVIFVTQPPSLFSVCPRPVASSLRAIGALYLFLTASPLLSPLCYLHPFIPCDRRDIPCLDASRRIFSLVAAFSLRLYASRK